jgi:hypothetical protein
MLIRKLTSLTLLFATGAPAFAHEVSANGLLLPHPLHHYHEAGLLLLVVLAAALLFRRPLSRFLSSLRKR